MQKVPNAICSFVVQKYGTELDLLKIKWLPAYEEVLNTARMLAIV